MANWNGFDFFIFLILTVNVVLGMSRGASKETISMMCLSAALVFSIKFTVPLSNFFNGYLERASVFNDVITSSFTKNFMIAIGAGPLTVSLLKELTYSISLLICFTGVFSVTEAGLSVTGFTESFSFPYATLSRKVGGALGFIRGYIICLLFLSILSLHLYKANDMVGNWVGSSFFANLFSSQTRAFDELVSSQKPENYQKLYQNVPYNEQNLYQNFNNTPGQTAPTQTPNQAPTQKTPAQTQGQTSSRTFNLY